MISAGTDTGVYVDLGKDEPGMILQSREGREWHDIQIDGKTIKSPLDLNSLPPGRYRLV